MDENIGHYRTLASEIEELVAHHDEEIRFDLGDDVGASHSEPRIGKDTAHLTGLKLGELAARPVPILIHDDAPAEYHDHLVRFHSGRTADLSRSHPAQCSVRDQPLEL